MSTKKRVQIILNWRKNTNLPGENQIFCWFGVRIFSFNGGYGVKNQLFGVFFCCKFSL
jgi:hypothetical protein